MCGRQLLTCAIKNKPKSQDSIETKPLPQATQSYVTDTGFLLSFSARTQANMTLQASSFYGSHISPLICSPGPTAITNRNHRPASQIRAQVEPSDKSVEIMRKFSEQYARKSGTYFCVDKSVTSVVIKGLADHKDSLGAPLCPCRHYDDKPAEAQQGFWNCPCVPMRERKECHCMLFLTPDNDFAGQDQAISLDEIKTSTENM